MVFEWGKFAENPQIFLQANSNNSTGDTTAIEKLLDLFLSKSILLKLIINKVHNMQKSKLI